MCRAAMLACCLTAVCLPAAPPKGPWLRVTSANFELFTTAGERPGRELVRHFEEVRGFFAHAFHLRSADARPARIIVFRNEKEYEPYRPNDVASAYFQGGGAHDFIVIGSASNQNSQLAAHEYMHLLLRQAGPELPVWLNEGLAELYSNLEPQGQKVLVGRVIPMRARTLMEDRWIPLRTLLEAGHDSSLYNERARAGMFYAESWLLVHMLQMSPAYKGVLAAMTDSLQTSYGAGMLETASGRTAEQMEIDLRNYMHSPTLGARLFSVQLPKSVDAPEVRNGADFEARLALAELFSDWPGKGMRSLAEYHSVLRDFPDRWEALAGVAEQYARQRMDRDAESFFRRAVEQGANDAGVYIEYARLETYSKHPAEALRLLQRAVELDKQSPVAHFELGAAEMRGGRYLDALKEFAALQTSRKLPLEYGARLVYALAFTHYKLGQFAEARQVIAQGRTLLHNPEEVRAIGELSRAIENGK